MEASIAVSNSMKMVVVIIALLIGVEFYSFFFLIKTICFQWFSSYSWDLLLASITTHSRTVNMSLSLFSHGRNSGEQ